MLRSVITQIEKWPLHTPFRIARGVRSVAEIVTVSLSQNEAAGRGEGSITPRFGESIESLLAQLREVEGAVRDGITRAELRTVMPAGSARNALGCALWDLEARLTGGDTTTGDCADLDGPLWLKEDRPGGVKLGENGYLRPPSPDFWG